MKSDPRPPFYLSEWLWDAWCILSVVGLWPRFIEPNLLATTSLTLQVPNLPPALQGFKIVQFCDLHLHPRVPRYFLKKLIRRIKLLSPDIIAFTGDFLCYSELPDREQLKNFLNEFSAPYGCYAVLGNHDYSETVTINAQGDYDLMTEHSSAITKGFQRLCSSVKPSKTITPQVRALGIHQELLDLLKETSFELLHNKTKVIPVKDTFLNIAGLGEYTLGRCHLEEAFVDYDNRYPGLVLLHNPDGTPLLENYPGELILSGHTHGGQINLPWIWKKFTLLENPQFKKELIRVGDRWLYVSRGVGSVFPFRWFAIPEIVLITLEAAP